MTSPATKKNSVLFLIIALLAVGLFYFFQPSANKSSPAPPAMKPSQLNFSDSNNLKEVKTPVSIETENKIEPSLAAANRLNADERKRFETLNEILKSKNDNDPRMDTELKNLSSDFREALYEKYNSLSPEDRNERGLLVFLIARDLKTDKDMIFLEKVYQESPCLSLSDCKSLTNDQGGEHTSMQQTTLNYPQLTGLYQVERLLQNNPSLVNEAGFRGGLNSILKSAESFSVPQVYEKAQRIRKTYGL